MTSYLNLIKMINCCKEEINVHFQLHVTVNYIFTAAIFIPSHISGLFLHVQTCKTEQKKI